MTWLVLTNPISVSSAALARCKLLISMLVIVAWRTSVAQDATAALQWPLQPQDGQKLQVENQFNHCNALAKCETSFVQECCQPWIKESVEASNFCCWVVPTLPSRCLLLFLKTILRWFFCCCRHPVPSHSPLMPRIPDLTFVSVCEINGIGKFLYRCITDCQALSPHSYVEVLISSSSVRRSKADMLPPWSPWYHPACP